MQKFIVFLLIWDVLSLLALRFKNIRMVNGYSNVDNVVDLLESKTSQDGT